MAEIADQRQSTRACTYAWFTGLLLVAFGVLGFFYSNSFGAGAQLPAEDVLGIFAVNGWANALHVVTGVVGLAAMESRRAARAFAFCAGSLYVGLAIWGFVLGSTGTVADLFAVNTADNIAHLLIGALGISAALGSSSARSPVSPPAEAPTSPRG